MLFKSDFKIRYIKITALHIANHQVPLSTTHYTLNLNVTSGILRESYHLQLRFLQITLPLILPLYITQPAIEQISWFYCAWKLWTWTLLGTQCDRLSTIILFDNCRHSNIGYKTGVTFSATWTKLFLRPVAAFHNFTTSAQEESETEVLYAEVTERCLRIGATMKIGASHSLITTPFPSNTLHISSPKCLQILCRLLRQKII